MSRSAVVRTCLLLAWTTVVAGCVAEGPDGTSSSTPVGEQAEFLAPELGRQGTLYFSVEEEDATFADLWQLDVEANVLTRLTYVRNISWEAACGDTVYVDAPREATPGEIGPAITQELRDGEIRPIPGLAEATAGWAGERDVALLAASPSQDCTWALMRPRSGTGTDVVLWDGKTATVAVRGAGREREPERAGWSGDDLAVVVTSGSTFKVELPGTRDPRYRLPRGTTYAALISSPRHLVVVYLRDRTVIFERGRARVARTIHGWLPSAFAPDGDFLVLRSLTDGHLLGLLETRGIRTGSVKPWLRLPVAPRGWGSWTKDPRQVDRDR